MLGGTRLRKSFLLVSELQRNSEIPSLAPCALAGDPLAYWEHHTGSGGSAACALAGNPLAYREQHTVSGSSRSHTGCGGTSPHPEGVKRRRFATESRRKISGRFLKISLDKTAFLLYLNKYQVKNSVINARPSRRKHKIPLASERVFIFARGMKRLTMKRTVGNFARLSSAVIPLSFARNIPVSKSGLRKTTTAIQPCPAAATDRRVSGSVGLRHRPTASGQTDRLAPAARIR